MATKVKLIADNAITTTQIDTSSLDSHFSGGTGVTYSSGEISIGQAVHSTDSPTFADLTLTGDLNITGNLNSYNVTDLDVTDQTITLGAGQTEALSGGSGIIIDGSNASILWDETNDVFDFNKGLTALGNVGIGTNSPDAKLEVEGRATGGYTGQQETMRLSSGSTTLSTGEGPGLVFHGRVSSAGGTTELAQIVGFRDDTTDGYTSGGLAFYTRQVYANPMTKQMTIDENGNMVLENTGALTLNKGTTAQRPSSPITGMLRYNTSENEYEVYTSDSIWKKLETGSFPYTAEYLVIAGGGGGYPGTGGEDGSGGGGAGGYRSSVSGESSGGGASAETALTFTPGTTYTITIGGGGTGGGGVAGGGKGTDSSISGTGITTVTSNGGGAGERGNGGSGGSGGGGGGYGGNKNGGAGTAGQGYDGGNGAWSGDYNPSDGGGGGGAASAGGNARDNGGAYGAGGNGVSSSITGSAVTRAAGARGGSSLYNGSSGTANTGNGGEGAGNGNTAGNGGSGVVILKIPTANYTTTTTGSPTVTTSGSYTIMTFTSSGTYTA